jgi:hypothetical protein
LHSYQQLASVIISRRLKRYFEKWHFAMLVVQQKRLLDKELKVYNSYKEHYSHAIKEEAENWQFQYNSKSHDKNQQIRQSSKDVSLYMDKDYSLLNDDSERYDDQSPEYSWEDDRHYGNNRNIQGLYWKSNMEKAHVKTQPMLTDVDELDEIAAVNDILRSSRNSYRDDYSYQDDDI